VVTTWLTIGTEVRLPLTETHCHAVGSARNQLRAQILVNAHDLQDQAACTRLADLVRDNLLTRWDADRTSGTVQSGFMVTMW